MEVPQESELLNHNFMSTKHVLKSRWLLGSRGVGAGASSLVGAIPFEGLFCTLKVFLFCARATSGITHDASIFFLLDFCLSMNSSLGMSRLAALSMVS